MGNNISDNYKNNSLNSKMFNAIRADKSDKLKYLLNENKDIANIYINNTKTYTPIMCSVFFNAVNSLLVLLDYNANYKLRHCNKDDSLYHIAAERDNLEILKILIEKQLVIDELYLNKIVNNYVNDNLFYLEYVKNLHKMNPLDSAIVKRSYRVALFLYFKKGMSIKDNKYYTNLIKLLNLEVFNVSLFIECIKKNIEYNNTPSFLIKVKELDKFSNKVFDDVNSTIITKNITLRNSAIQLTNNLCNINNKNNNSIKDCFKVYGNKCINNEFIYKDINLNKHSNTSNINKLCKEFDIIDKDNYLCLNTNK